MGRGREKQWRAHTDMKEADDLEAWADTRPLSGSK